MSYSENEQSWEKQQMISGKETSEVQRYWRQKESSGFEDQQKARVSGTTGRMKG